MMRRHYISKKLNNFKEENLNIEKEACHERTTECVTGCPQQRNEGTSVLFKER
jgi:hypothetical protein